MGGAFGELFEHDRPSSGVKLGIDRHPTTEESRANGERLSEDERRSLEQIEHARAHGEESELKTPAQLPDLDVGPRWSGPPSSS